MNQGDELSHLLRRERSLGRQPLVEALLEKRSGDGSPTECGAAERLLIRHAPWALDLHQPVMELLTAVGDQREQQLFLAFLVRPEGATAAQLAAEAGVSAAEANRVVRRAARRLRSAQDRARGPLPWVLRTLRDRLGDVTTVELAARWTARLGAAPIPDGALLLWLAGPYLPISARPGWLALEPVATVSHTLQSLTGDGGVRRISELGVELEDLGIRHDQLREWLTANGAVVVHGLAVLTSGPLRDAVERLLDAHGKPCPLASLSAELTRAGREVEVAHLERAIRGPRFARTRSGAVLLAEWASAGREGTESDAQAAREATRTALPGRLGAKPGEAQRIWLAVPIDRQALRGAEGAAPAALADGLGLRPNSLRVYASRWGPVSLAHQGSHLVRGSVRAVALASGARGGDTLMLGFSLAGDLLVEVHSGEVAPGGPAEPGATLYSEMLIGGTS